MFLKLSSFEAAVLCVKVAIWRTLSVSPRRLDFWKKCVYFYHLLQLPRLSFQLIIDIFPACFWYRFMLYSKIYYVHELYFFLLCFILYIISIFVVIVAVTGIVETTRASSHSFSNKLLSVREQYLRVCVNSHVVELHIIILKSVCITDYQCYLLCELRFHSTTRGILISNFSPLAPASWLLHFISTQNCTVHDKPDVRNYHGLDSLMNFHFCEAVFCTIISYVVNWVLKQLDCGLLS